MSKTFSLEANKRDVLGKQVRSLRREGILPGNIFSRGKDSFAVQLSYPLFLKTFALSGKTHPIELVVDGNSHLVLVSELDVDPSRGSVRHVSFHEVKKGEKVTADVPVHLVGDSPAERINLIIVQINDTVQVEAEATNIPDHFEADKSKLAEADDVLMVSDLSVPEGVSIMDEPDTPIAKVEVPRAEVEEEPAEAEAGEEGAEETGETAAEDSGESAEEQ